MSTILRPKLGFAAGEEKRNKGQLDEGTRSPGPVLRAARRKVAPEFMNRIDKAVVFKPLDQIELRKILLRNFCREKART